MRVFSPSPIIRDLHRRSDNKHLLVETPECAEMILIFTWQEDGKEVEPPVLAKQYPGKCFVISWSDLPQYFVHGVYVGASGKASNFANRIRSGSYRIDSGTFTNPAIGKELLGSGVNYAKDLLFSFVGRNCHSVREKLLNHIFHRPDVLVEDSTNSFDFWKKDELDKTSLSKLQTTYCETLKRSKFALCPRGVAPSSVRLYEALKLGIAPVIISDGWKLPLGPEWKDFSIVVPEKHISELEQIAGEHEANYKEMGKLSAQAYDDWFSEGAYFNFIVTSCLDIMKKQWLPEPLARKLITSSYLVKSASSQIRKNIGFRTRIKKLIG